MTFILKIGYFQKHGDFSETKETRRLPLKQGLSLTKGRVDSSVMSVGDIMSTPEVRTLGDTMSTPGAYLDECRGYNE